MFTFVATPTLPLPAAGVTDSPASNGYARMLPSADGGLMLLPACGSTGMPPTLDCAGAEGATGAARWLQLTHWLATASASQLFNHVMAI